MGCSALNKADALDRPERRIRGKEKPRTEKEERPDEPM